MSWATDRSMKSRENREEIKVCLIFISKLIKSAQRLFQIARKFSLKFCNQKLRKKSVKSNRNYSYKLTIIRNLCPPLQLKSSRWTFQSHRYVFKIPLLRLLPSIVFTLMFMLQKYAPDHFCRQTLRLTHCRHLLPLPRCILGY